VKGEGEEKLPDYFEGQVRQFAPEALKDLYFKKVEGRKIAVMPKSLPVG
jgi:hypothetical protein